MIGMAAASLQLYRSETRVRTRTRLYSEIDRTKKELEQQIQKTKEAQEQIQKEREQLSTIREELVSFEERLLTTMKASKTEGIALGNQPESERNRKP